MSSQGPLFHDDFNDSLLNLVKALGRGKLDPVAKQLWPTKPNSGRWLSDCLNPDREAKLAPEEVVALLVMGREAGIHWAMHKLCEIIGYVPPEIAAPKTPRQILAEQRLANAVEAKRLADEEAALDRADSMRDVRKVSSLNDR